MIAADLFWIVFRFLHIVSGILWVGSAFAVFTFVEPTVAAMGPDGGKFMGFMVQRRKLPVVITSLSGVTVLAGIVLYLKASDGLDSDWLQSGPGIGFTIGALAGIAAMLIGLLMIKPTVEKMEALGGQIAASGGPPTPEQGAEMGRLQHHFHSLGRTDLILILIAATAMATARYW